MSAGHVQISGTTLAEMDRLLGKVAVEVRERATQTALKSAGKIIVDEAQMRVRLGTWTGTTKLRSAKHKKKNPADTLWNAIGMRSRYYDNNSTALLIVGARRRPGGSVGHLLESGHRAVYWGRPSNDRIRAFKWLQPAIDKTKSQVEARIILSLQRAIKRQGG